MAAIVFDGLDFSITIRPQQSFLMSSIIRHVMSHTLEGNVIRVPEKEGLFRVEKGSRKLGSKRLMKMSASRAGHPC